MFQFAPQFGGVGTWPGSRPQPLPAARSRAQPSSSFTQLSRAAPNVQPGLVIADRWGAVSVPAQPAPVIVGFNPTLYPGDPALAYLLSFLYAFLVTDGNANVPWSSQWGYPLINSAKSLFDHDPSEASFNVSYLPALYIWRDDAQGGKIERWADDWLIETAQLTMLWALPLGGQDLQRQRHAYANQFVKAVVTGLDRGVTPSWVQPGDPDPQATTRGSFIGYWLNALQMYVTRWRRTKIRVAMSNNAPTQDFPAVEIKIEMLERLDRDLRRFPSNGWLDLRLSRPSTGAPIEEEFVTG